MREILIFIEKDLWDKKYDFGGFTQKLKCGDLALTKMLQIF